MEKKEAVGIRGQQRDVLRRGKGFTGIGCVAVLPQVLDKPQDDAGHHRLSHAEQVGRCRGLALLGLGAVPVAEPASTLHSHAKHSKPRRRWLDKWLTGYSALRDYGVQKETFRVFFSLQE